MVVLLKPLHSRACVAWVGLIGRYPYINQSPLSFSFALSAPLR